eukprot:Sspe_Gene.5735::Locus_1906_Transcript_1_1_Confidence_1.000_Length_1152::g.5735::m.5735
MTSRLFLRPCDPELVNGPPVDRGEECPLHGSGVDHLEHSARVLCRGEGHGPLGGIGAVINKGGLVVSSTANVDVGGVPHGTFLARSAPGGSACAKRPGVRVPVTRHVQVHSVLLKELLHSRTNGTWAAARAVATCHNEGAVPGGLLCPRFAGGLQIRLQPPQVLAVGSKVPCREYSAVPFVLLPGPWEVRLCVHGDKVHRAVVEGVPHALHTTAFLRRHVVPLVVRGEVRELLSVDAVDDAQRGVALRLVVPWEHHEGHGRGQVLHPVPPPVLALLVHPPNDVMREGIIRVPYVTHNPHQVDRALLLQPVQLSLGGLRVPVLHQPVDRQHHRALLA